MNPISNPLDEITIHGVMIKIFDVGVLITGESGIGKSELALNLIVRGHPFIADDAVTLHRDHPDIIASCPPVLQNFLEVRGLGILDVQALYGTQVMAGPTRLDLILHLIDQQKMDASHIDRLEGLHQTRSLLNQDFLEISIPVGAGRHLAVLAECAVENFQLKQQGYDALAILRERQAKLTK